MKAGKLVAERDMSAGRERSIRGVASPPGIKMATSAAQAANPANSERVGSLVDWRGFGAHDAHDTKKILGAGCGFGGRGICVGWSLAAARNFPRNRQRASTIEGDWG